MASAVRYLLSYPVGPINYIVTRYTFKKKTTKKKNNPLGAGAGPVSESASQQGNLEFGPGMTGQA